MTLVSKATAWPPRLALALIGTLLWPVTPSRAADKSAKALEISLGEAVQFALRNNRELRAARLTLDQARARLSQSGRLSNPEVELSVLSDAMFANRGGLELGAGVYQHFPITSRLGLSRQIARVDVERASCEIREHERMIAAQVRECYIRVAEGRAKVDVLREIERQQRELEVLARKRLESGQGSTVDVALAAASSVVAWDRLNEAQAALVEEEVRLKTLLGYPANHSVRAGDTLSAALSHVARLSQSRPREIKRPDLESLMWEVDRAGLEARLAKAEAWDGLRVGVEYLQQKDPGGGRADADHYLGVRVSLPVPVWDNKAGAGAEKRALRDQAAARLEALRLEIENDLQAALWRVGLLKKRLAEIPERGIAPTKKAAAELRTGFEEGRVDLRDLLAVRAQLSELELAVVRARAELALAYVKVASVAGVIE